MKYFWSSTVITEIATLNIGSRPASRKKTQAIEDLRAIPWVFSWAQCRLMLPGWFGFGSAVKEFIDADPEHGLDHCSDDAPATGRSSARCCPTWTWCCSKSSLAIASRYARSCPMSRCARRSSRAFPGNGTTRSIALNAIMEQTHLLEQQSAAAALDPQPLPLSRPAQSRAGRIVETASRAFDEREGADRHPVDDQRHLGGAAQQRVDALPTRHDNNSASGYSRSMTLLRLLNRLFHGPALLTFLAMGLAAGGFALCSFNLFELFHANFQPDRDLWRDGGVRRRIAAIAELVAWGYIALAFYVVFKGCRGRAAAPDTSGAGVGNDRRPPRSRAWKSEPRPIRTEDL